MMTVTNPEVKLAATSTQANTNERGSYSKFEQERQRLMEEMRQAINEQNWSRLGLIVDTYARMFG